MQRCWPHLAELFTFVFFYGVSNAQGHATGRPRGYGMNLHGFKQNANARLPEPDTKALEKAIAKIQRRVPSDQAVAAAQEREALPPLLERVVDLGRNTSIYLGGDVLAMAAEHNCSLGYYITGVRQVPLDADGQMKGFGGALWDNNEYQFESYFLTRVLCGDLRRAATPEEADLCYPVCGGTEAYAAEKLQRAKVRQKYALNRKLGGFDIENIGLMFEVPEGAKDKWSNCDRIGLFYETEQRQDDEDLGLYRRCKIMVPYIHGVAQLTPGASVPYDKIFNKTTVLTYVGGTWQGRTRGTLLQELTDWAAAHDTENDTDSWFSMPVHYPHNVGEFWHTPEMHKLVWEQYAAAEFSWQPFGDTATRRGFYDSWMMGAMPIVSFTSAKYYRRLFNHAILGHISDYVMVAPPKVLQDGPAFMRWLLDKNPVKIQKKRERMRQIAPLLQYGWESDADALTTAFGVLRMFASDAEILNATGLDTEANNTSHRWLDDWEQDIGDFTYSVSKLPLRALKESSGRSEHAYTSLYDIAAAANTPGPTRVKTRVEDYATGTKKFSSDRRRAHQGSEVGSHKKSKSKGLSWRKHKTSKTSKTRSPISSASRRV